MRKNKHFALGTAALLLSTAGFTACSSDDAFTGSSLSGEAVKTQFAINIPTSGVKGRMTAENTQNSNNFLGMHKVQLIPMTTAAATGATFSSVVNLGDIAATGGFETDKPNTKVYKDVNVPVGTTNFLFYGAGNTTDPTDATNRFAKGLLNQDISGSSVDNIAFSLQPAKVDDNGQADILKGVLNGVAQVSNWGPDCTNAELKDLYNNFITLKAGSANSICKTLEELYNAVNSIQSQDATVQQIVTDIKNAIVADGHFTYDEGNKTLTANNLTYPQNMNMPDGAAALTFDSNPDKKEFSYNSSSTMGDMTLDMTKVCYPASIYYFVNTTVKASNNEQTTWPNTKDWANSFTGSDWGDKVLATTRSIALTDPIQYGVAQLALTAKCNSSLLTDKKDNQVSVPADGYPITGVLIGGQPDQAGWDFAPKGTSFTQVVYDNTMNGDVFAKNGANEGTNYTLVLDNYQATPAKVNIAVEFKNTGADFYGANEQIIPTGAKFYLIAQLDPNTATNAGTVGGTPYVFMKDYTTTANLTIKNLSNAYNTIPDLRSSELSLGLTVNLDWNTGLNFNVDIN